MFQGNWRCGQASASYPLQSILFGSIVGLQYRLKINRVLQDLSGPCSKFARITET